MLSMSRSNDQPKKDYAEPAGRNVSVYLHDEVLRYVEKVAAERGMSRNLAFTTIITEHSTRASRSKR